MQVSVHYVELLVEIGYSFDHFLDQVEQEFYWWPFGVKR
jgi:hypothetical protein